MKLTIEPTPLPDVFVITPEVFEDERGFFMETY
jgi:dTDP-4-dehydrorhamnose 3,5-epimerase-like enzyme